MDDDSDLVEIKDVNGASMRIKLFRNKIFPHCFVGKIEDRFSEIAKMQVRPDDVFIASFPKSGTHWIYNIADMLVQGKTEYCTNFILLHEMYARDVDRLPSPRIIATHLPYTWLPQKLKENKKIKIINVCRNPKDTCVSFYQHAIKRPEANYKGTWEGFLEMFMKGKDNVPTLPFGGVLSFVPFGPWFGYIKEWEKVRIEYPHILFVQYEDVKKNLLEQVLRMAKYLGKSYDQAYYDKIVRMCSFERMQMDLVASDASVIYRKGKIGDWKNHFTVAQNEAFDLLIEREMADSNVKFQFM